MDPVYIGTTSYGRHWLDRPAADSWQRMVRDGCPADGITDAGRTDAEQVAVFLKYFTTDYTASARVDRRVWQGQVYWRRPGKPSAATPGSPQARHVSGRALDLNGSTKAWVRANGYRYGWIKDIVRGEDWHMEYQSIRDVVAVSDLTTTVPDTGQIPTVELVDRIDDIDMTEDDDMLRLIRTTGTETVVVTDGIVGRELEAGGIERLRDLGFKIPIGPDGKPYVSWVPNDVFDRIRTR